MAIALKMPPQNVTGTLAHAPLPNNSVDSGRNYGNYHCTDETNCKKIPADNVSSPDLSERSAADQQKTILLKIPNVSESEQLLVSG